MSRFGGNPLILRNVRRRHGAATASPRWAKLPHVGRFCRAVYASLTIRRRRSLYSHAEITTMRIYGPNGTTLGSPASNTRRTSSTGFSLPVAAAPPDEPRTAAAARAGHTVAARLAHTVAQGRRR